MPTAAEWEYACRGGPAQYKSEFGYDYYFEKPSLQIQPNQANFGRSLKRTYKVGQYAPNKLGLFDMHGSVWEWTDDEAKDDQKNSVRVCKGGSWEHAGDEAKAAHRLLWPPHSANKTIGLRVARVPAGAN